MAREHHHPPCQRVCLLSWVHQPPAWGPESWANQSTAYRCPEHCTEHLARIHKQHQNRCWSTHTRATQQSACADWWTEGCSLQHEEVLSQRRGCTHKRAQPGKGPWARAQGPKTHSQVEANASTLLPTTLATVDPKLQVVIPAWSLPQPEAGPSRLPPPQPEAGPSCLPSVYISAFNSIEALEKNYLAQSPSHSLTDPTLHQEREGVLNRIVVDKLVMKHRPLGPASSVELPPPGETSVGFPWRPVPEHLVNLLGIREPLTAGNSPLSQKGQLPCPLGWTSLPKAQWFDLCPMTDLFFKETVEVMKEITPTWCTWYMHTIMWWLCEAYQSKKPPCFKIREDSL